MGCIEISTLTDSLESFCYGLNNKQKYYGWNPLGRELISHEREKVVRHFRSKFETGDEVKICLNIAKKTLIFYRNNAIVYTFVDVDISAPYRLGISIYEKYDSIQIKEFQIKSQDGFKI